MKNKKNYTFWYLTSFLFLIILFFTILALANKEASANKVLNEVFSGTEAKLVYLARPGCTWCQKTRPILDKVRQICDFKYNYINTGNLNSGELKSILRKFEIDENEFGTPTFVVVENGKIIDTNIGYMPEKELVTFLKNAGIINNKFGE